MIKNSDKEIFCINLLYQSGYCVLSGKKLFPTNSTLYLSNVDDNQYHNK